MSAVLPKSLFFYLTPYLPVLLLYLLGLVFAPHIDANQVVFQYLPFVLYFFAAILSLHFNRSRLLYAAILLSLCYSVGFGIRALDPALLYAGAILFPLNLVCLSLLQEHSLRLWQGWLPPLVLIVQLGLLALIGDYQRDMLWLWLNKPILALPTQFELGWPQSVLIANLVPAVLLAWRVRLTGAPTDNALLGLWVAVVVALNVQGPLQPLLYAAAGVILIVSAIQVSYRMAYLDELTGLPGRRAFNEHMARLGRNYAIAMADVDHFKKFNDTHGHDVGDQVLKMVAVQLARTSGGCKVYRYGGEEFALIFPSKSSKEAKPHLEALREAIADYPMSLRSDDRPKQEEQGKKQRRKAKNKGEVSVTVSIGIAQRGEGLDRPEQVLKAADEALYQAKKKGRNRVII